MSSTPPVTRANKCPPTPSKRRRYGGKEPKVKIENEEPETVDDDLPSTIEFDGEDDDVFTHIMEGIQEAMNQPSSFVPPAIYFMCTHCNLLTPEAEVKLYRPYRVVQRAEYGQCKHCQKLSLYKNALWRSSN